MYISNMLLQFEHELFTPHSKESSDFEYKVTALSWKQNNNKTPPHTSSGSWVMIEINFFFCMSLLLVFNQILYIITSKAFRLALGEALEWCFNTTSKINLTVDTLGYIFNLHSFYSAVHTHDLSPIVNAKEWHTYYRVMALNANCARAIELVR